MNFWPTAFLRPQQQFIFDPLVRTQPVIEAQPSFENAIEMRQAEEQKVIGAFPAHGTDEQLDNEF